MFKCKVRDTFLRTLSPRSFGFRNGDVLMFMDEGDNGVLHIESITYQCKGLPEHLCMSSMPMYHFLVFTHYTGAGTNPRELPDPSKEDSKEEPKEGPKEGSKEEPKEETKEGPKEAGLSKIASF